MDNHAPSHRDPYSYLGGISNTDHGDVQKLGRDAAHAELMKERDFEYKH